MFKFYVNIGMKLTKIRYLYRYKQSPWLTVIYDHNTQNRTQGKTTFDIHERFIRTNEQCFLW